jgi:5-methyltetrahydropteroyltriglutamate--homocysteine methyltransferase
VSLPPVAATTVGSFPRPAWLATNDRFEVDYRLQGDQLKEAQDDATVVCIREQEDAGLDLLTDGEQRRPSFVLHLLGAMEGFDLVQRRPKKIRRRADVETLVPRVVGPVKRPVPILVDDLRFARLHTTHPLKMAVPGPMTIVDTTVDEAYHDEAALAMDAALALNAELLDLQAAGCDVLQIDEPAMTRYHEKVAAYGAVALDRCLAGITVPTIVHLCYGYPGGPGLQHQYTYPELIEMLMETRIGGFSLEFARSGYDPSILRLCGDRLVMFGCVDPGEARDESLAIVVERVRRALDYVDPAKLLIAPDCGLLTLDRPTARQKAGVLAAAAQELRATL